eukprot:3189226-Prymnesium_polylepis.2
MSSTASSGLSSGEGDSPSRSILSSSCRHGSLKFGGCLRTNDARSKRISLSRSAFTKLSSSAERSRSTSFSLCAIAPCSRLTLGGKSSRGHYLLKEHVADR